MSEYINLDLESLVDILVEKIKEYDRMLSTRVFGEEEFTQCKQTIAELHVAIIEKAEQEGYPMKNVFPNFPHTLFSKSNLILITPCICRIFLICVPVRMLGPHIFCELFIVLDIFSCKLIICFQGSRPKIRRHPCSPVIRFIDTRRFSFMQCHSYSICRSKKVALPNQQQS